MLKIDTKNLNKYDFVKLYIILISTKLPRPANEKTFNKCKNDEYMLTIENSDLAPTSTESVKSLLNTSRIVAGWARVKKTEKIKKRVMVKLSKKRFKKTFKKKIGYLHASTLFNPSLKKEKNKINLICDSTQIDKQKSLLQDILKRAVLSKWSKLEVGLEDQNGESLPLIKDLKKMRNYVKELMQHKKHDKKKIAVFKNIDDFGSKMLPYLEDVCNEPERPREWYLYEPEDAKEDSIKEKIELEKSEIRSKYFKEPEETVHYNKKTGKQLNTFDDSAIIEDFERRKKIAKFDAVMNAKINLLAGGHLYEEEDMARERLNELSRLYIYYHNNIKKSTDGSIYWKDVKLSSVDQILLINGQEIDIYKMEKEYANKSLKKIESIFMSKAPKLYELATDTSPKMEISEVEGKDMFILNIKNFKTSNKVGLRLKKVMAPKKKKIKGKRSHTQAMSCSNIFKSVDTLGFYEGDSGLFEEIEIENFDLDLDDPDHESEMCYCFGYNSEVDKDDILEVSAIVNSMTG